MKFNYLLLTTLFCFSVESNIMCMRIESGKTEIKYADESLVKDLLHDDSFTNNTYLIKRGFFARLFTTKYKNMGKVQSKDLKTIENHYNSTLYCPHFIKSQEEADKTYGAIIIGNYDCGKTCFDLQNECDIPKNERADTRGKYPTRINPTEILIRHKKDTVENLIVKSKQDPKFSFGKTIMVQYMEDDFVVKGKLSSIDHEDEQSIAIGNAIYCPNYHNCPNYHKPAIITGMNNSDNCVDYYSFKRNEEEKKELLNDLLKLELQINDCENNLEKIRQEALEHKKEVQQKRFNLSSTSVNTQQTLIKYEGRNYTLKELIEKSRKNKDFSFGQSRVVTYTDKDGFMKLRQLHKTFPYDIVKEKVDAGNAIYCAGPTSFDSTIIIGATDSEVCADCEKFLSRECDKKGLTYYLPEWKIKKENIKNKLEKIEQHELIKKEARKKRQDISTKSYEIIQ